MAIPSDQKVVVPAEKARQGRWGRNILMVLAGGLILAAAAWAGVEFFGRAIETPATQGTDSTQ